MRHRQLLKQDVFLASYPKSGNTWLRHLLTHVATGQTTPWRGGLDKICNLVGRHHELPKLADGGGRLIKTHEPYRSTYRRAVLLVRDGRDVAVSEYFYQRAYSKQFVLYKNSFATFLDRFLKGKVNSYQSWQNNLCSWLDAEQQPDTDILLVRFEELKVSTLATLRAIVTHIGIEATDEALQIAIDDCSVESMKKKEKDYWESKGEANRSFVRSGKNGGWREHFTAELEEMYWNAAGESMRRLGYKRDVEAVIPISTPASQAS